MDKRLYIIFSSIFVLIVLAGFFYINQEPDEIICGDGSLPGQCSFNQPYFCENGKLISKPDICGCPKNETNTQNFCYSEYFTEQKTISLSYFFNGLTEKKSFLVYSGVKNYISSIPDTLTYMGNESPSLVDFKLRNINDPIQKNALMPLVIQIQNSAQTKVDQARIAINLVQNIEYGFSNKTISLNSKQEIAYSRYPYEVLFEQQGVCGEKTELLLFLLRELGFKTAFFYYGDENHEALGIGCPVENSVNGSGYCFVETTGPAIISDDTIVFVGGITLESTPEIYSISEGYSLPENLEEYSDAKKIADLRNNLLNPITSLQLDRLEEKYRLINDYQIV